MRWVLLVVVLGLTVLWVYALVFAPRTATYRVADDAWRAEAERICTRYEQQRVALADMGEGIIVDPTPQQMIERAAVVDRATDLLEAALDDVVALPLESERDRGLVADYERYYRTVIADRRVYTERLRSGDLQPYYETALEGGPVTNTVNDFTVVNELPSCAVPGDLGG